MKINELITYVDQLNLDQKVKDEIKRQAALKRIKELREEFRHKQKAVASADSSRQVQ